MIIGTSTLAEIVIEILAMNDIKVKGFWDDFSEEKMFLNLPVLGRIEDLIVQKEEYLAFPVFVAIGDNSGRKKVMSEIKEEGFNFFNVIHPKAHIEASVQMDTGNFVGAFTYIGCKCVIGEGNIFYHNVIVSHHNSIGDYNFISPQVSIGGFTQMGHLNKIGMNSVVKPYIHLSDGCYYEPLSIVSQ